MKASKEMKQLDKRFTIGLGIAFLVQSVASLISGAFLFDPQIVEGDMIKTMENMYEDMTLIHLSFLLDIITAIGIIWLGVLLFQLGKKINHTAAIVALGLYILEAMMLMGSRSFGFALLQTSIQYVENGGAELAVLAEIMLQSKDFLGLMAMVPFGIGAILFYGMMCRRKIMPSWLPRWGFLTIIPIMIGAPLMAFGVSVPFLLFVPYVPFEFTMGILFLVVGIKSTKKVI